MLLSLNVYTDKISHGITSDILTYSVSENRSIINGCLDTISEIENARKELYNLVYNEDVY